MARIGTSPEASHCNRISPLVGGYQMGWGVVMTSNSDSLLRQKNHSTREQRNDAVNLFALMSLNGSPEAPPPGVVRSDKRRKNAHRFRRKAGIVQEQMVRLPTSQKLGAEDFVDDRPGVSQTAELNVTFGQQFEATAGY